jgi:hypothetical protein
MALCDRDDDDGDDEAHDGICAAPPQPAESETRSQFCRLYMDVLTEGAPDELDALRREKEQLDERSLTMLVDALEFGADTFSPEQATLALRSYQHRAPAGRAAASSGAAAAVDYECNVPELIAKGRALVNEVCSGERKQ